MDMAIENSSNQDEPKEQPPSTLSGRRRPRDDDNSSPSPDEQEIIRKRKLQKVADRCGFKRIAPTDKQGQLASFVAAEEAFIIYQIEDFLDHLKAKGKQEAERTGKPVDDARSEEIFQEVKRNHQFSESLPYRRRMASLILLMYQTKMEMKELKHTARGMWNHRIAEGFRVWIADRVGGKDKLHQMNGELRKKHNGIYCQEYDRRVKLGHIAPGQIHKYM